MIKMEMESYHLRKWSNISVMLWYAILQSPVVPYHITQYLANFNEF